MNVSIVLPTYNEAESLKTLIPEIKKALNAFSYEIVVVDDNSPDGTGKVAKSLGAKTIVRTTERGLATAVIRGFKDASGEVCVVMDADGSHPINKLPDMITPILNRSADITVGSRYIKGGDAENWPLHRKIGSKGAGLLAIGLTKLSDPTSGFMGVRKSLLDTITLDPTGWKIVLEVVAKCPKARILEVPITFKDREHGESKANLKVSLQYLQHLGKLYFSKLSR